MTQPDFEIEVYAIVFSESLGPESISSLVGTQPDPNRTRGDTPRPGSAPVKSNIWRLLSGVEVKDSSVAEQLQALHAKLSPHIDRFRSLPPQAGRLIKCVVYAYTDMPDLTFTPRDLGLLLEFDTPFEMVIYDLTSTAEEPATAGR